MGDVNLAAAAEQIRQCLASQNSRPVVKSFFDEATFTATHVAHDPVTLKGVIIDSVLDFDFLQAALLKNQQMQSFLMCAKKI